MGTPEVQLHPLPLRSVEVTCSWRSNDIDMLEDALRDSVTTDSQNSNGQRSLYAESVRRSATITDSFRSIDIEMLQDALRDSLSMQSSDVQFYESLRNVETKRDSFTSIDIEILQDL